MSIETPSWTFLLESLLQGVNLTSDQARSLMQAWLNQDLSPVQTGAFLAGLRAKGMVADELAAMAAVLRNACPLPCKRPDLSMVDTCGTGGDGAETFNISTAVAFTAAACGVNVAKHGNRSASGKIGSADVLEALGLHMKAPLNIVVEAIRTTGVTFLFAPAWHPALVELAPLRRSLGVRTAFNLLGPLVNPLRPQAQVLGVAQADLLDPIAVALQRLGVDRAVVVHGAGGLDEASLSGVNEMRFVEGDIIRKSNLSSENIGLSTASLQTLKGGDLALNKKILQDVLQGNGSNAHSDVVSFNTALVLWAAGHENDLSIAAEKSSNILAQGLPWKKLEDLKMALISGNCDENSLNSLDLK